MLDRGRMGRGGVKEKAVKEREMTYLLVAACSLLWHSKCSCIMKYYVYAACSRMNTNCLKYNYGQANNA